jgi:UDP-N-acetylglucosamine 1-carboxyvinyltransferase
MQDKLTILGGNRLEGEVRVSGAKNSALPLLIATLLTPKQCEISNVPDLEDIAVTLRLLRSFGAKFNFSGNNLTITTAEITNDEAPYGLVKALRASFWVLGPLLARFGSARVALPGGDAIGTRPVDLHLQALTQLGADIRLEHGVVIARAPGGLQPGKVHFDFPSVGATHQVLMTAALIPGETIVTGAAREPEIVELGEFLIQMGAEIEGLGTEKITINGKTKLNGATTEVLGDRIEAATYLVAAAVTKGAVKVTGIEPNAIMSTLDILRRAGCEIITSEKQIILKATSRLKAVSFETAPFPGVATDVQPILLAALCVADGQSEVRENVFENRFGHVAEYRRFGADISLDGRVAKVIGMESLGGAPADIGDIRAGAGLIILGLVAEGETVLSEVHHLDRGYEALVERLTNLNAKIFRVPTFEAREIVFGC